MNRAGISSAALRVADSLTAERKKAQDAIIRVEGMEQGLEKLMCSEVFTYSMKIAAEIATVRAELSAALKARDSLRADYAAAVGRYEDQQHRMQVWLSFSGFFPGGQMPIRCLQTEADFERRSADETKRRLEAAMCVVFFISRPNKPMTCAKEEI